MTSIDRDVEKFGAIRERAGKLEQHLTYAYCLLGILEIPELKDIPVSVMARIQRRIYRWTEIRYPLGYMYPSLDVWGRDVSFRTSDRYRMSAVFEFCAQELEKRAKEEGA